MAPLFFAIGVVAMTWAAEFHTQIDQYNILKRPTEYLNQKSREYPSLYKGVLIVNHLFRAVSTWAFLKYHRSSMAAKISLCLAGSVIYRLTVEVNCAYKFALPAFGGALALLVGEKSLPAIIHRTAFHSIKAFGKAFLSLTPFVGYFFYITLTTSYDVDHRCCRI